MANLRANRIVSTTGSNAITGSVEFANNSSSSDTSTISYLSLPTSEDFNYGTGDFTMECWINRGEITNDDVIFGTSVAESSATAFWYFNSSGNLRFREGSNTYNSTDNGIAINSWNHIAVTRESGTLKIFVNGIVKLNQSGVTQTLGSSSQTFQIGRGNNAYANNAYAFKGFISNFRIIKGTALYTQDFIPPTSKLTKLPGTVLLCCQDNESVTTEVTGKTITANGDPTATRFTPSVGSDGSVEFAGPTTINTENYFYLPTGPTEQRFPIGSGGVGAGTRGLVFGGYYPSAPNRSDVIDYVTIASTGDAVDFGDRLNGTDTCAACASATRALNAGGYNGSATINTIEYVTIASTGNAQDFGDLTLARRNRDGCSSSTRGLFGGGFPTDDAIEYVTIATSGNSIAFGNLTESRYNLGALASPVRGVFGGGSPSTDTMDFVTIATTADAIDFGNLTAANGTVKGTSSETRGIFGFNSNVINYITIASTGDAVDFGDLNYNPNANACTSSLIRGIFMGGGTPVLVNTISYITIASTGDAVDFGDLTQARQSLSATSSGHGGLG